MGNANKYTYIARLDDQLEIDCIITKSERLKIWPSSFRFYLEDDYILRDGYYEVSRSWHNNGKKYFRLHNGRWFKLEIKWRRIYVEDSLDKKQKIS